MTILVLKMRWYLKDSDSFRALSKRDHKLLSHSILSVSLPVTANLFNHNFFASNSSFSQS